MLRLEFHRPAGVPFRFSRQASPRQRQSPLRLRICVIRISRHEFLEDRLPTLGLAHRYEANRVPITEVLRPEALCLKLLERRPGLRRTTGLHGQLRVDCPAFLVEQKPQRSEQWGKRMGLGLAVGLVQAPTGDLLVRPPKRGPCRGQAKSLVVDAPLTERVEGMACPEPPIPLEPVLEDEQPQ